MINFKKLVIAVMSGMFVSLSIIAFISMTTSLLIGIEASNEYMAKPLVAGASILIALIAGMHATIRLFFR